MHHVTRWRLEEAYWRIKPKAAAGVDGVTWTQYGESLEENLKGLFARLRSGGYQAKPSRRAYIPKADGRQRPLGVASLEDKIVQGAVVKVLNAIYECDFLGFSYGFRPGRGPHNALDALTVGLRRKVSWVLDADIRGFFDAISHEWLLRFLEHRIADQRILRLIRKWLNAGVLENGELTKSSIGTPQGATISPLLANVYLHYVFDLWANQWRKRHARGEVIIVRYADDFIVGFQHWQDAERFLEELRGRLRKFHLELHPEKTRLIEFGRFAIETRKRRGQGKPETFDFLGFTHKCGRTTNGKFLVLRHTAKQRLRRTLQAIKEVLRRHMHRPLPEQGAWLRSVVRGYFAYHAVPTNFRTLDAFKTQVTRYWLHALRRRSQKARVTWETMDRLAARWLPRPRILDPWPEQRFAATTRGKSPVR
jgi:group II intron reverse transcriptase/maturase